MAMHSLALQSFLQSLPLKISTRHYSPKLKPAFRLRCSSGGGGDDRSLAGEAVSGMVDEILKREENKALLDGLEEASRRVERAREAMADIERRKFEASQAKEIVSQLENRKLDIEKSQRELLEARAMVDKAERSLSTNINSEDDEGEAIDKALERVESIKTASVSAITGTLAALPIYMYQDTSYIQLALHLATIFISCALFGVTFRYTVRRDLDNVQLKAGTSAAFGLVRGFAALGAEKLLELDASSLVSFSIDGTVLVFESIFIFLSASIALDFCLKTRLLSPFPVRKSE